MIAQNTETKSRPVVLVVDDDPAVRNSLKFSLEIEGFEVAAYQDGAGLLAAGTLPRLGCLVIDYRMPGMDGLEVLDQLRARDVLLPAVLITSHPDQGVRERAAAAGAPVVEKPLLGNALLNTIRDAVERQKRLLN